MQLWPCRPLPCGCEIEGDGTTELWLGTMTSSKTLADQAAYSTGRQPRIPPPRVEIWAAYPIVSPADAQWAVWKCLADASLSQAQLLMVKGLTDSVWSGTRCWRSTRGEIGASSPHGHSNFSVGLCTVWCGFLREPMPVLAVDCSRGCLQGFGSHLRRW